MVAVNKVIAVILAILFVCSVFFYGTGKAFSLELYVDNVAKGFSGIPSLEGFADIWSGEVDDEFGSLHGGGAGHRGGDSEHDESETILDTIVNFFSAIGTFFANLWNTVLYVVDILVAVFKLLYIMLPWNAVVGV